MMGATAYIIKPSRQVALERIIKCLLDFWMICEVPRIDDAGKRLRTESGGKLGERFPQ
jgi:hypothetical protein